MATTTQQIKDLTQLAVPVGTEHVAAQTVAGATVRITVSDLQAAAATDHGALTGLADDDHSQYLTETRHDALAADNPHSVTAAQVGADPIGTDNSTNVSLVGTGTYISLAGQVITVDPITESDISDLGTYLTASSTATLTNKTFDANGTGNSLNNVDLAADMTGNLPVANLGSGTGASASTFWRGDGSWATPSGSGDMISTNNLSDVANVTTSRTNLGVDAAGTDNSTNVSLAGSLDYITIAGQVITRGAIDLATDITGQLTSANIANLSGTNTGDEVGASLTAAGIVELATITETNTGTDATRAVTPDGLDGWTGSAQVTTLGTITTGDVSAIVTESFIIAVGDETTAATTGTAKVTFRMPYAFTLTEVRASCTTAPTGSVATLDINETGTTILSTKLTIDATEKTSETAATAPVISDSALADDAEITIDIDGIGSTVAGAGYKIYLIGHQ